MIINQFVSKGQGCCANECSNDAYRHVCRLVLLCIIALFLLTACDDNPFNNPHPKEQQGKNILYSNFAERPKTLDPARSYNVNEALFTAQIYEPPLQYHYLKRPYELIPLSAQAVPTAQYLDAAGNTLPDNAKDSEIAKTVYTIKVKPGIFYQPHPALAKDPQGKYYYNNLSEAQIAKFKQLSDFRHNGTRELTAADFVYEIKRLASPKVQSPIYGLMSDYISGLSNYAAILDQTLKANPDEPFLDLRKYPLEGARVIDRYTYQIILDGKYPQFLYWLAMQFFAPIPWEADEFYSQPGMKKNNISFDWYPIGTGPYMLTVNNPNKEMILLRNPYFHGENYPTEGEPEDAENGLLADAGKPMPFVDQFIFNLEVESIPRWNKFLQGYYDQSGISSDSFDEAIRVDEDGQPELTQSMQDQKIRLQTSVEPTIFYLGFNMLDNVVGGNSERARKLRQAIAIALDYDEFISIFLNGRGVVAQGPLPPGLFGYRAGEQGIDPYVYDWIDGKAKRKPLSEAKRLLAEAGYPNGIAEKTGKPLVLHYDAITGSGPEERAQFNWMRKQFAKLGIELYVRATHYNRFQEKMRTGKSQLYSWGWSADYPDPENFLFLLYGPNSKVKHNGENASNYQNPEFDSLFEEMKTMPNGPERQAIIDKMLEIVRKDHPWVWGFHQKVFLLFHQWNRIKKPSDLANNTMKYSKIDPELRVKLHKQWNQANFWPILIFSVLIILILIPVVIRYIRKEHSPPELIKPKAKQ